MSDDDTTIDVSKLEKLIKTIKGEKGVARVGILGTGGSRRGGGLTNAQVGAIHEYGSGRVPQRSWLRMPLATQFARRLNEEGGFDADMLAKVIATASFRPWLDRIAVVAEDTVLGAFETNGYGAWPQWSRGYTNNTGNMLVDTQQLRNAVTSDVDEEG